jgi:hypothetical protein
MADIHQKALSSLLDGWELLQVYSSVVLEVSVLLEVYIVCGPIAHTKPSGHSESSSLCAILCQARYVASWAFHILWFHISYSLVCSE